MLINSPGCGCVDAAFEVRRASVADSCEKPPDGDDWIHEVKFDGYRSQIIIDHDVRIFTRNGLLG